MPLKQKEEDAKRKLAEEAELEQKKLNELKKVESTEQAVQK